MLVGDSSIGRIVSVTGAKAIVLLDGPQEGAARFLSDRPEMGTLLAIDTATTVVLAIVSALSVPVPAQREGESEIWIAELGLVGELWKLDEGLKFNRGVTIYPALGDRVRVAAQNELSLAFTGEDQKSVRVGTLRQDASIHAKVRVDDLLGKHFAILGTTGTGKSCTTALILRSILNENPAAHIVLLDPHNEYATAFKEWGEVVSPRNMQLPFWLLNFEEIVEVLIGDPERKAEIEILQELIPIAKAKYAASQNKDQASGSGRLRRNPNDAGRFTVDTPVPYRTSDLVSIIDDRMGKLENKRDLSPYRQIKSRIEQISQDARYAFMFGSLTVYDGMAQILGRIFRVPVNNKPITILELTGLPPEIVNVVVSVLCRMTFDFAVWAEGQIPVTLVCEEAHRYVPACDTAGFAPCKRAIAKIAKEGRKYGASLCIVTQRPAEIDPTILSQCNTVFALRMSNDKDQAIVQSAVSDTGSGLLEFLPALGQREAIAFGDGVSLPVRIKFDDLPADCLPRSSSARFSEQWQKCDGDAAFLDQIVERWRNSGNEVDENESVNMLADSLQLAEQTNQQPAMAGAPPAPGYAPPQAHAPAAPPQQRMQQPQRSTQQLRREAQTAGGQRPAASMRRNVAPAPEPAHAGEPAPGGRGGTALKSLRDRLSQRTSR
ncbi:MAG: DUF87 domain-containing protein [Alphaproteobacteria bacterium]|nr:DUF87 domain-containing protein [Alphaproteobacteria bacterium]